ncbi:TetR/AcrR family transcriptional regulator [Bradyrhizobium sp. Pear76]|uniref:TetR/AcrR family transcriptional regulator n=1 Tax=Bradyrhizobium oropedii TaxID=1571201 RepID=UPI001E42F05F|nr:TetR/AcrR family transcriptional regulator [Bradyrhizobium oropedii]MCC8967082.1 TetR/AcrR family transcriptional regulator [Bradyrhizobium oropedii]
MTVSSPTARRAGGARTRRTQIERREETERRLLDAAVELIAQRGLERFTLAEVGESAGYSRAAPAFHFGNKDGLIEALARNLVGGYQQAMDELPAPEPGLEHLLRNAGQYFERAERFAVRYRALFAILAEARHNALLREAASSLTAPSTARIERNLRAGIEAGDIRADIDPKVQAMIILTGMRGLISHWLIDPKVMNLSAIRKNFVETLRCSLAP